MAVMRNVREKTHNVSTASKKRRRCRDVQSCTEDRTDRAISTVCQRKEFTHECQSRIVLCKSTVLVLTGTGRDVSGAQKLSSFFLHRKRGES
eukprot:2956691-Rhodomonas_salina.2